MHENQISKVILDAAIEVHRTLGGPGLLERVYEEALAWELAEHGLTVERQKPVPIVYKDHTLATPLRLDLLVDGKVIVECKATSDYRSISQVQTSPICGLRISDWVWSSTLASAWSRMASTGW